MKGRLQRNIHVTVCRKVKYGYMTRLLLEILLAYTVLPFQCCQALSQAVSIHQTLPVVSSPIYRREF